MRATLKNNNHSESDNLGTWLPRLSLKVVGPQCARFGLSINVLSRTMKMIIIAQM